MLNIDFFKRKNDSDEVDEYYSLQKDIRNLWSNFNFDDKKEELYEKEQRFLELDDILFSYITSIFDVDFLLTYFNCTESYTDTVVDKDKLETEYDLLDKYVDVNGNRYASAKNYEDSLTRIFTTIKSTTDIDRLSMQLKKYDLLLNN